MTDYGPLLTHLKRIVREGDGFILSEARSAMGIIDELEEKNKELLRENYRLETAKWANVCASEVFHQLKHGKFRDILYLLQDQKISVGKAAQSIVERANGIEPKLPEGEAE